MFSDQAKIQIGGTVNEDRGTIERPFLGVMAGVLFNGLRPLDKLVAKDAYADSDGDIKVLANGIPFGYKDEHPEYFSEDAMRTMMEKAAQHYPATSNSQAPGVTGNFSLPYVGLIWGDQKPH